MDLVDKAKNYVSEKVAEKVANMEKPEATIEDVDVKKISFDSISYHAKVSVTNPYKVPIPIMEIAYVVKSAGRIVATGTIPDPGSLKAKSTTLVDVPAKVPHSAIVSLVMDIAADWDIDYTLELGLIIDLPVIGNFTIPLSYSGEYKLPTLSDLWRGDDEEEKDEKDEKDKKEEKVKKLEEKEIK
ncbi:PREDICTED: desiccation protectant protein Lea14 homolog [Nicotiana attenuata]|uniref:Desiccation protectant protein lea14-like protein n=1 Tax=Nicotiana attenuata TaxID=49451 RepID=A0A1J6INZ1_NICAT|nr:PREDICTED: desiccation protectant protein Lea14 homolog [Nicotiana attenuata]OIS99438.1 desiccation protectant protein lea14-like protein [Nicotiana attenuata]